MLGGARYKDRTVPPPRTIQNLAIEGPRPNLYQLVPTRTNQDNYGSHGGGGDVRSGIKLGSVRFHDQAVPTPRTKQNVVSGEPPVFAEHISTAHHRNPPK